VVASNSHSQPVYYFVLHFLVEFLPWIVFIPTAFIIFSDRVLKRRLLAGFAFVIVMFSLFVCKRNVYILPAFPLAAMFIGGAWDEIEKLSRRGTLITGICGIGLMWVGAAVLAVGIFAFEITINRMLLLPSIIVLTAGGVVLLKVFKHEQLSLRWMLIYASVILIFEATATAIIMPALNDIKGPVEAAAAVREKLGPDRFVYLYRQQLAIFPLYAGMQGREIDSREELAVVTAAETNAIVVFRDESWSEIKSELKDITTDHAFKMGYKQMHWVEFNQPASL
jgi:4-amino-4-deoxy-L-arabinose transferase-like glycosyltransferase